MIKREVFIPKIAELLQEASDKTLFEQNSIKEIE